MSRVEPEQEGVPEEAVGDGSSEAADVDEPSSDVEDAPDSSDPDPEEPEATEASKAEPSAEEEDGDGDGDEEQPEPEVERRTAPRKGVRLNKLISGKLVIGEETTPTYLHLVDISEGGLRINGDLELPKDTGFQLVLSLEAFGSELASEFGVQSFKVQVVWQKQLVGGMWVAGLKFLEQTEANRQVVQRILERASPEGRRLRFRLNRVLGVEIGREDESRWIYPLALDLSVEGMRIRLDEELSVGESFPLKIFLEFELPTVEVTSEVMWQEQLASGRFQVGLKFTEISDENAGIIKDYIDRCLEQDRKGRT